MQPPEALVPIEDGAEVPCMPILPRQVLSPIHLVPRGLFFAPPGMFLYLGFVALFIISKAPSGVRLSPTFCLSPPSG
jgi:hypothetical protein